MGRWTHHHFDITSNCWKRLYESNRPLDHSCQQNEWTYRSSSLLKSFVLTLFLCNKFRMRLLYSIYTGEHNWATFRSVYQYLHRLNFCLSFAESFNILLTNFVFIITNHWYTGIYIFTPVTKTLWLIFLEPGDPSSCIWLIHQTEHYILGIRRGRLVNVVDFE